MPRAPRSVLLLALLGAASSSSAQPMNPPPLPGARDFVANGVRLWYRVAGAERPGTPPVVFLHGGPGQGSAHFDALVGRHLEPRLRLVYYDQRGSGRSERPWTRAYTMSLLVDDIDALRRELGVPRIALVGHSFGGLLALEYAAAHPERVSHLVFVAGLWDAPRQCRYRLRTLAELRPDAYARVAADTVDANGASRNGCMLESQAIASEDRNAYNTEAMFPTPAVEARMDSVNAAHGIRNTGEMGQELFGRGGLGDYAFTSFDRLTMPVLVIAGGRDGAARPEGLRDLTARLPNAWFLDYPASGHFVYLDEPDRFARDVAAFIRAPRR